MKRLVEFCDRLKDFAEVVRSDLLTLPGSIEPTEEAAKLLAFIRSEFARLDDTTPSAKVEAARQLKVRMQLAADRIEADLPALLKDVERELARCASVLPPTVLLREGIVAVSWFGPSVGRLHTQHGTTGQPLILCVGYLSALPERHPIREHFAASEFYSVELPQKPGTEPGVVLAIADGPHHPPPPITSLAGAKKLTAIFAGRQKAERRKREEEERLEAVARERRRQEWASRPENQIPLLQRRVDELALQLAKGKNP